MRVLIAAAGGAAHLAGVVAAHTLLPVLGVPMQAWSLDGLDSLLAMAQMPRGIPVATLAIGSAGATNAAAAGRGDPGASTMPIFARNWSTSARRRQRRFWGLRWNRSWDSRRPRQLDSRVGPLNILNYPNVTSAAPYELAPASTAAGNCA